MTIIDAFRLDGRLAVVTGASRGIGAAIAVGLAEAGADVVGISRSMPVDGAETGEAVRAAGRRFYGVAVDLAQRDGFRTVPAAIAVTGRDVDILVNNAGIAQRAPVEDHSDEQWDDVVAVNLSAPFRLTREIGRGMLERGRGRVIMLASRSSYQSGTDVVSYTATKTGIVGLTRALANEWAGRGVGVNAIAPGYVETELTLGEDGDPQRVADLLPRIPAGRWAQPEDIAGAAVFLASDAADYVHGAVIPVDGGWLAR